MLVVGWQERVTGKRMMEPGLVRVRVRFSVKVRVRRSLRV